MELSLKTEKNDGRFLFSALSYQDDIVLPTFNDARHLDWVKYGDDNMFPHELLTLFNKSGIHNAIIESKTRMMSGDGIVQDKTEGFSDKTQMFIDKANPYESMDQVYGKCAMDFELYGLAYIEVLWGKGKKQIAELHHIDATKIRWSKLNDKNRIDTFYYSRDWSNYRKEQYVPIEIPVFNDEKREARQIIPIVRYTPGLDYYAFPDYIASTKWIAIDTEIANFHFNNLKNGMTPSIFFGFPVGDTTNEEREVIDEKIREKYAGTNNASKFILAFYDAEGDKKPEVTILESPNADKMYDILNKTTLQQILVGHKVVNENLVGISTPGKLGSSNEVLQNYELYFNTVVQPEQQKVLDQFRRVMLINGMNDISILDNKPLSMEFSESIMAQILTRDEMRDVIGYEPGAVEEKVDEEVLEEDITESDDEILINKVKFKKIFAGVRTIDKGNAGTKVGEANLDDTYMWRTTTSDNCPSCYEIHPMDLAKILQWKNKDTMAQEVLEEDITESDDEIVVNKVKFKKIFAGVRTIDKGNAGTKVGEANLDDTYMWRTTTSDNCPSCKSYNGKTRTLENWLKWAIPGQRSGTNFGSDKTYISPFTKQDGGVPYGTFCEEDCHCKLVKVGKV